MKAIALSNFEVGSYEWSAGELVDWRFEENSDGNLVVIVGLAVFSLTYFFDHFATIPNDGYTANGLAQIISNLKGNEIRSLHKDLGVLIAASDHAIHTTVERVLEDLQRDIRAAYGVDLEIQTKIR